MELSHIKEVWVHPIHDQEANRAAWDMMAARYTDEIPLPAWDTDPFLQQVEKEVPLHKGMSVLDIGCGAGGYAIALAKRVGQVVGIDLSEKMLSHAEDAARREGVANANFLRADFREAALPGKFDLVFAHMTPAVADAASFEKMLTSAKSYCYLVKPVHRTDSVLNPLKRIIGKEPCVDFDESMLYAFSWLWRIGKLPSICYRPNRWESKKGMEEAMAWYLNRLKTYCAIDEKMEENAMAYLREIAMEGYVQETIHTTIATMAWRMDEEGV